MKERLAYIISIAVLLVILALMAKDCSSKDAMLKIANQNTEALMDSTRATKNKLNQLQFEKKAFMADIETLRRLNSDLIKEADAQKGNTRVITKVVTKVVFDTIKIDNRIDKIDDSTFVIGFSYKKSFDSINSIGFNGSVPTTISSDSGNLSLKSNATTISDLSMQMKLYTGLKEDNGIYSIFARTDFPGIKFDLDGAIVDPEKSFIIKKPSPFSVMLGGGIGYGLTTNGTGIFPSVGVFVGINLFHF